MKSLTVWHGHSTQPSLPAGTARKVNGSLPRGRRSRLIISQAKKNRAFPVGNALFLFAGGVMNLFRLPRGKLPLPFLAVPAGKDGWVECPCQTVDDFIGIRGSICGLFLFVQTHAPLIVPPWQSRARKSKFQFLSGARARMLSALHMRLVAR